jgi:hypothetical protein
MAEGCTPGAGECGWARMSFTDPRHDPPADPLELVFLTCCS